MVRYKVVCIKQGGTQYYTRAGAIGGCRARATDGLWRETQREPEAQGGGGLHNGGGVGERDGRRDGSRVVREVRTGRRACRAVARRVVRGGGRGLLSEREQQAHRVPGERAGGLRDEEGAGDATALRVGVVVGRRRAHSPRGTAPRYKL